MGRSRQILTAVAPSIFSTLITFPTFITNNGLANEILNLKVAFSYSTFSRESKKKCSFTVYGRGGCGTGFKCQILAEHFRCKISKTDFHSHLPSATGVVHNKIKLDKQRRNILFAETVVIILGSVPVPSSRPLSWWNARLLLRPRYSFPRRAQSRGNVVCKNVRLLPKINVLPPE